MRGRVWVNPVRIDPRAMKPWGTYRGRAQVDFSDHYPVSAAFDFAVVKR